MSAELVLPREAAGQLLRLEARGRPAFVRLSLVQGEKKARTVVWEAREAAPPERESGWLYLPQVRTFLEAFDVVKIYSARGIRIIPVIHRPSTLPRAQFRRLVETYGRQDPMPSLCATVVGLGRLGSKVAWHLSEQGAGKLILVDPQRIERPNQQLAIYRHFSLGVLKVQAMADFLKGTEVVPIAKALYNLSGEEWSVVLDSDAIFVCVDNVFGRALACLRAMEAGLPLFEGGVHVLRQQGRVVALLGRVQTALPGFWCLFDMPEGLDQEALAEEVGEALFEREDTELRLSDPTLSDWVAATMVLAFRQALLGQGIRPRYLLQAGLDGHGATLFIRETPIIVAQSCPYCRPSLEQQKALVGPKLLTSAFPAPGQRTLGHKLAKAGEAFLYRVGPWLVGIGVWLFSLGLTFGLLLAVREAVGFKTWNGNLPNLGSFLWHFDSWVFRHTSWHYFGTVPSALVFLALPYLVFVLPLRTMRSFYNRIARWLIRRRIKGALQKPLLDTLMVLRRLPAPPAFRLPSWLIRIVVWAAQGLAVVTEAAALLILFPMFKAWGGQAWLVLTFSCLLPFGIVAGFIWGAMANHQHLARTILSLASPHRY